MNIVPTMYGATPSRMSGMTEEIMKFVASQGKACIHPFNSLPYKYFEGGNVGREKTMKLCFELASLCDEFAMFGISEETLTELNFFYQSFSGHGESKPIHIFVRKFDTEYRRWAEVYRSRFPQSIRMLEIANFGRI